MTATQAKVSIHLAYTLLQVSRSRFESAAAELGIKPIDRVNFTDYYSEADVDRIGEHLNKPKPN